VDQIIRIGMDTSKHVFQLHGVNVAEVEGRNDLSSAAAPTARWANGFLEGDNLVYNNSFAQPQIIPSFLGRRGRSNVVVTGQLVDDAAGSFYFKGESDNSIWLSPHDEIPTDPCDAAPDEIDIATAIDRFEGAVNWPVERVERSWAGLRSFAPDRLLVYGFDPAVPGFFWCAGQGGFGIQTAPAGSKLAAAILLGEAPDPMVEHIDPAIFSPRRFA